MTGQHQLVGLPVRPFPTPGLRVQHAYRELAQAEHGSPPQVRALGDLSLLPRPWDPASCTHPDLQRELHHWLQQVVGWLVTEHTWTTDAVIPPCWDQHPHLIHQIAVIADQRRRAGLALTSDLLEDWHRYALPAFRDRMRNELKAACDTDHQPWPGRVRAGRYSPAAGPAANQLAEPTRLP